MATDYAQVLRSAGLRVTGPRVALMKVARDGGHSSVEQLRQGVLDIIGSVSTHAGLLREVRCSGALTLYEVHLHDNHHHLVCRGCGRIEDVPCAVGSVPCLQAAEDHGYVIDEAEVTYRGYCPDCQRKRL